MTGTIYNTTDGPLPYDRAGRMLAARESMPVDDLSASPIAGHVSAGRFIVTSDDDDQAPEPTPETVSGDDSASDVPAEADSQATSKRRRGGSPTPAPSTQEA